MTSQLGLSAGGTEKSLSPAIVKESSTEAPPRRTVAFVSVPGVASSKDQYVEQPDACSSGDVFAEAKGANN